MLKEGMTLLEQLEDRADLLEENGYQHAPVRDAIVEIKRLTDSADRSGWYSDLHWLDAKAANVRCEALKKEVEILKQQINVFCKIKGEEPMTVDKDEQIKAMAEDIIAMGADLVYLNKMCMTLMSLLPPETTPDDIRAAMAKQGSHVREEKRIITDV